LAEAIAGSGRVLELLKLDYKRNVMSGMKWTNEWLRESEAPNQEYLFLIEKR
jgi:adenine-specific DNA-methyltransferase